MAEIISFSLVVFYKVEERTKKLKKRSITDELTDLFNRRHILELLELELDKSRRYSRNFSLIMMDIYIFKKINDNYGHQFGDNSKLWSSPI